MSLDEAVELVLFAFEHGNQGDLFVNKAPAGTIGDLAQALKELSNATNEIKVIGTDMAKSYTKPCVHVKK
jgi:UDP-glucose 4-epimerase